MRRFTPPPRRAAIDYSQICGMSEMSIKSNNNGRLADIEFGQHPPMPVARQQEIIPAFIPPGRRILKLLIGSGEVVVETAPMSGSPLALTSSTLDLITRRYAGDEAVFEFNNRSQKNPTNWTFVHDGRTW
jgi:hypothetical protein